MKSLIKHKSHRLASCSEMELRRESCLPGGRVVYLEGELFTWRESCLPGGRVVYLEGELFTWRESCLPGGRVVYLEGELFTWTQSVAALFATSADKAFAIDA